MFTKVAVAALALASVVASGSAVAAPVTKDLGVPSKQQTAPSRIISGDAGQNTITVAYLCYYRDDFGNLYYGYREWWELCP
jgi:hypothetical protein